MAKTFPCPPIESLREQIQPLVIRLREAMALPADLDLALVSGPFSPPQNLLRLVYTLPASESHHDAEPLGLVSHSLRVAIKAVELYRERVSQPAGGDTPGREAWLRNQVAIYLTALMHDVGKLFFLDVTINGRNWSVNRYLADFARETGAQEMLVRHRPGRTRSGPNGHEPIALVYLTMVIPLNSLPRLGSQALNDLLATLASTLGAQPSSDVYRLVKDADTACTAEVMRLLRKPPASPARDYLAGSNIADDMVNGFRRIADDRRLRYNMPDGHVLVSASHTILFINMSAGIKSVFRLLFEAMHQEVVRLNIGGYSKSFYEAGDPFGYLSEIATRTLPSGTPWCVPATAELPDKETIRHLCVVSTVDGAGKITKRRTGHAIILRNEALWGPIDPAAKGYFPHPVALFATKTKVSADPEDLGFVSSDSAASGHRARARPMKLNTVIEDADDGVSDIELVVASLMHEVGDLVPLAGSDVHHQRWTELSQEVKDRAPKDLILQVLEACLDRLRQARIVPPTRAPEAPASTEDGLVSRVAAVLTALVAAARKADIAYPISGGGFHALRLPQGAVFLPWPQCLDQLLDANDQVLASSPEAAESILNRMALPMPSAARINGFTYGAARRSHRGLLVPAEWVAPADVVPATIDEAVIRSGELEGMPAGHAR